jgi:hypothetical protein
MATKPKPTPTPDPDPPEPDDDIASEVMTPTNAPNYKPGDAKPPAGANNLTFGQKAVGVTFNPSGNPDVDELKRRFALIIDQCHLRRQSLMAGSDAHRLWSIAITEAQGAQMWAVKAATWKD